MPEERESAMNRRFQIIAVTLLLSCSAVANVTKTIHVVRTETRKDKLTVLYAMIPLPNGTEAHIKLSCVPESNVGCGVLEPGDYPAEITGNGKSVWITGRQLFDNKIGKEHFVYTGNW